MKRLIKWLLVALGVLILLGVIGNLIAPPDPTPATAVTTPTGPKPEPQLEQVTAGALYAAYEANGVAADARYKGRPFLIEGQIQTIDTDILDTPYVTLRSGEMNEFQSVQAMFPKAEKATLAGLSKGQVISVACTVDGKMMNVIARNCRLRR